MHRFPQLSAFLLEFAAEVEEAIADGSYFAPPVIEVEERFVPPGGAWSSYDPWSD